MGNKEAGMFKQNMCEFAGQSGLADGSTKTEDLHELISPFEPFWEIKLYWGTTLKFPYGTYIVEFTSKGRKRTSKSFLHHELMGTNHKKFDSVLNELKPFALYIDKNMLEQMINYATELRKQDTADEVSSEKITSMLGGAFGETDVKRTYQILEGDLLFDLSDLALLSDEEEGFDPQTHKGIILDTNEYKNKDLVAITRYTLMDLFVWDEEEPRLPRGEYKSNARCRELDEIIQGWEDCGYLVRSKQGNHKGQKVKGAPRDSKNERFYIISCPKVHEALKNGKGGGINE